MDEERWFAATDHRGWQGYPKFDFVDPPDSDADNDNNDNNSEAATDYLDTWEQYRAPATPPGCWYVQSDSETEDEKSPHTLERLPFWLHTIRFGEATPMDKAIIRILAEALQPPKRRSIAVVGSKANLIHLEKVAVEAAAALDALCPSIDRIRYNDEDDGDGDGSSGNSNGNSNGRPEQTDASGGGSSTDLRSVGATSGGAVHSSGAPSAGGSAGESIFSEVRRRKQTANNNEVEDEDDAPSAWAFLDNIAPHPPGYDQKRAWRTTKRIDRFLWRLWSILEVATRLVPPHAVHPGQATLVAIVSHLQKRTGHGAFFNNGGRYCKLWGDLPLFYECMTSGSWVPPSEEASGVRHSPFTPFNNSRHVLWTYWHAQNVFYARSTEAGVAQFDNHAVDALRDGLEGGHAFDPGEESDSDDNNDYGRDDRDNDSYSSDDGRGDDDYADNPMSMSISKATHRSDVSMRDASTGTVRPATPGPSRTRRGPTPSPARSNKSDVSMRDADSASASAASTMRVTRSVSAASAVSAASTVRPADAQSAGGGSASFRNEQCETSASGQCGQSDYTRGVSFAFSNDVDRSGSGKTYGPLQPRPLRRSARIEAASLSASSVSFASTSASNSTVRPEPRVTRRSGRQKWLPHLLGTAEDGKAKEDNSNNSSNNSKGKGKRRATTPSPPSSPPLPPLSPSFDYPPRPPPPSAPIPKTCWELLIATAWLIHSAPALLRLSNSGDYGYRAKLVHGDDNHDPVGEWLQVTEVRRRGLSRGRWDFWKAQLAAWLEENPEEGKKAKAKATKRRGRSKKKRRVVAFAEDKHVGVVRRAVERALQEMDIAEDVIEEEDAKMIAEYGSQRKRKTAEEEKEEEEEEAGAGGKQDSKRQRVFS